MNKKKAGFMSTLLAMAVTLLAGCVNPLSPEPIAGPAPAEKEQRTLRVLYATSEAGSEAVAAAVEKYTLLTGVRVELNALPYNSLQEKAFSELAQQSGTYDLIAVDTPWMPRIIRHLEPLSGYMRQSPRPGALQPDDFIAKVFLDTSVYRQDNPQQEPPRLETISLDAIASAGFEVWSLPIQSNALTVSYRKDLFDDPGNRTAFRAQYGRELTIPRTLEEYLELARFFTRDTNGDGKTDLYGTTLMAGRHEANALDFKSFLASYGGTLLDDRLKPAFQGEAGVRALETYGSFIREWKVTPPDALAYTWDEVSVVFGYGQAAMGMNYHNMKLESRIKGGRVGYFMFPGTLVNGELKRGPHFGSWGLALNRYGGHKQDAYELAEYLTSPEVQRQYLAFNQHVTRKSAYAYAQSMADESMREYYQVLGDSLSVGVGRPRIVNYDQVSEVLQAAVQSYLSWRLGAKEALAEAAAQVEALLKEAGY